MEGIGNFFSSIFGRGGGGGFQPTDINTPPPLSEVMGLPAAPAGGGAAPLWQKLLTGGLFGAGELGNLLQTNKQNSYIDYLTNLMKNPGQVSQMVTAAERPLDNAFVQSINNRVQGDLAQRGLSQAPGIFAGTEAQALAPSVQQNQQTAEQQVLSLLGLPGQVTNVNQPPQSLAPALQMLLRSFQPQGQYRLQQPPPQQTQAPGITWPDSTYNFNPAPLPVDPLFAGAFNTGTS